MQFAGGGGTSTHVPTSGTALEASLHTCCAGQPVSKQFVLAVLVPVSARAATRGAPALPAHVYSAGE
jgi:hypothetical protein